MISWLGIDVTKSSLAVWLRPQDISFNVPNNSTGYAHLIEKLSGYDVQKVLLEATGGYERWVMAALRLAGFTVVRVNPRRARAFAAPKVAQLTSVKGLGTFKARYEGLRDKGKSAKVALVACMRVLLVRLNAMLRDGTAWRTSLTGQDSC